MVGARVGAVTGAVAGAPAAVGMASRDSGEAEEVRRSCEIEFISAFFLREEGVNVADYCEPMVSISGKS